MGSLLYFVTEAVRGCYQAKLMTFVSVLTIAVSMLLISGVILGIINTDALLRRSEDQADLAVYLTVRASEDHSLQNTILEKIGSKKQVQDVILISQTDAWNRFEEMYGSEILESVDENPFPASIEITLKEGYQSSAEISEFKYAISELEGIEAVQYAREWVDFVGRMRSYFFYVSLGLSLLIMLALHAMISNTIKLTIYARKELVRNMHYVGATDFFIKAPFLLEGMLQGGIGASVSVAVIYSLKVVFPNLPLYWGTDFLPPLILSIGVLFGWLGSQSAVRKFLV
ncbi:Cell division protein FtsX [Chitinispirillum alkaliphilum]|nr:Cell division protein FtsX [Chitinispirillum alkaliphilum]